MAKSIRCLGEDDLRGYSLLGRGVGVDLDHAFFEGVLHCAGFEDRVSAFRIVEDLAARTLAESTGYAYIAVEFYELAT